MQALGSKRPWLTRRALLTAAVLLAVALPLSAVRPLWLDEILQLIETRKPSTAAMIADLPRNPGAAPLGYLVQQAALRVTGYSVMRARLTPALFAAGATYLVVLLAVEMGLERPWLAGFVFAAFPLTLRYATESRVYSQAQFFSVLATLLYVRLMKRPGWPLAAGYCFALTAAAYTHPFAASVGVAHVIWSVLCRDRRATLLSGAALTLAGLAFLPWYRWSKDRWTANIIGSAIHFHVSAKTPLMLFRETIGAGYWGSGFLVLLCAGAVVRSRLTPRATRFQVLTVFTVVVCVLGADALFDYFIAARQFLWILPALAILAAAAIERRERTTLALGLLLCVFCARQSFLYFTAPGENWQAASDFILEKVDGGAGLTVVPPEQSFLYEFFQPALRDAPRASSRMVVAITPGATSEQRRRAITAFTSNGYGQEGETIIGRSDIICFRRSAALTEEAPSAAPAAVPAETSAGSSAPPRPESPAPTTALR